jgi:hypothetical protein
MLKNIKVSLYVLIKIYKMKARLNQIVNKSYKI